METLAMETMVMGSKKEKGMAMVKIKFVAAALALAACSAAQAQSFGPCQLGQALIMKTPSMIPSCVGTPLQNVFGGAISGAGSLSSSLAAGAASMAGDALVGAASQKEQQAVGSVAQDWGGQTNFGAASGFDGMNIKVIGCDEYSQMSPMVNPGNYPLNYEQMVALGLDGKGEVSNGWWEAKLSYAQWPTGIMKSQDGGAVLQYASLSGSAGTINQTAKVQSVGNCTMKITVPDSLCMQCPGLFEGSPYCAGRQENRVCSGGGRN